MGLSVAAMSYDGRIYISFCADERMPRADVVAMGGFLRDEFRLFLESVALAAGLEPVNERSGDQARRLES
jgi:hypothetical protein